MTHGRGGLHPPCFVLVATLLAIPHAQGQPQRASDTAVKALFLNNFVKFTNWDALAPAESLTLCVVGDTGVASALGETVRGQSVDGHRLTVEAIGGDASLRSCHVLFISKSVTARSVALLDGLKRLPILTASDSEGFAEAMGIIEFFVESDRMRFAINTDAADRAGLSLSSKLLALARIVRDPRV